MRTGGRADGRTGGAQLALLPGGPGVPLPLLDQRARGTEFRRLPVRSALNSPASTGMRFWSLNPYVGCEFGCSYCYARDTHKWAVERATAGPEPDAHGPPRSARGDGRSDPFERLILVKSELATVLRRTLDPARVGKATILIGTATDPYQPAERQFQVTREVLEALLPYRNLSIAITTKSSLVTRDIDVLLRLSERHDIRVNLSLASTDAELIRLLEPRTPLPHARLRALSALTRAGVRAGVLIAPILPGLTDSWPSLAAVMEAAKAAGAHTVHGSALRLGPVARPRLLALLRREFPDLARRYEAHYANRANARREYTRALARRIRLLRGVYGFAEPPDEPDTPAARSTGDLIAAL
ncbi:MAG TPA: radical SAM protein [Gemmatimonadales bacterium]